MLLMEPSLGAVPSTEHDTMNSRLTSTALFFYYYYFLAVLGLELRACTLSHSTSPFLRFFFFFSEIVSHELFAWGWL
jgi:hypothetical protein